MRFLVCFTLIWTTCTSSAQTAVQLSSIQPDTSFTNIHVQKLASDSLVSSFLVWVKDSVTVHKHAFHSETLLILEGKGILTVGDQRLKVKAGDFINVPTSSWHSLVVTSRKPLKALSIQAPQFLGKDRLFMGQIPAHQK